MSVNFDFGGPVGDVYGIVGQEAPELRVSDWLDNVDGSLRIADVEEPLIYLFTFQSWCKGCHSHGFPTMRKVRTALATKHLATSVKFVVVQTVFEGYDENTIAAARRSVSEHGLNDVALGHDSKRPPNLMTDYHAGGTPWTVIIGPRPSREVLYNDFHANAQKLLEAIEQTLSPPDLQGPRR